VLIAGCLLSFAGCKKKADETKPAAPAADVKTNAAKTTTEQPKAAAIETIPVADVKAEAGKMNLEQLKTKATEYKDLIVSKKATLATLTAKLKEIPLTQQMDPEAKGLQANIATLSKSVSALTERFQVYYNKYKEMGGDVSKLGI
jgi:hypothetical protein